LPRLGIVNVLRVIIYRVSLRVPFSSIRRVVAKSKQVDGAFILADDFKEKPPTELPKMFGYHDIGKTSSPPDWLCNPLNGKRFKLNEKPFFAIPDFDPEVGDIKQIWELSRFDWLLHMARDAGNKARINQWLEDWNTVNPAYMGPNWKCGQEASLRVIHLIAMLYLLGDLNNPTKGFLNLIELHLRRIAPTINYAKAQDNNHGTSEAAALYIGGSFLEENGYKTAKLWKYSGRRLLENRAARLIGDDGSFSQYSTTYHRLMLDSYSFVEWWRQLRNDHGFSYHLQTKLKLAAEWLYRLTDDKNGDVPNLGANDGAHILNIARVDYRDFRPSVAMAYALWHKKSVFHLDEGTKEQLALLSIESPVQQAQKPASSDGEQGGFAILKTEKSLVVLRYPRFRFRPSQNDIMHLDFFHNGRNILRDGGTYSYNSTPQDLSYFGGVASHNTVSFDRRDQMPRLGRFLFGAWPKLFKFQSENKRVSAGYKDFLGFTHERDVQIKTSELIISDTLNGDFSSAQLRWRLDPSLWGSFPELEINEMSVQVSTQEFIFEIKSSKPIIATWEKGQESRYYLHKSELPVLSIEIQDAGVFVSKLKWVS